MDDSFDLGIPGLRLVPGDHVCAFYRGLHDRDEILIPYLRAGLRAGDKCMCIVDATDPETVIAVLGEVGVSLRVPTSGQTDAGSIDVSECLASQQLEVRCSTEAYLRGGRFSTGEMLTFWQESLGAAFGQGGFSFARSVGEMTWALRDVPGADQLIEYESELNRFLPRYPQVILCLYDLDCFSGEVLVDILATHPKILVGGTIVENPYHLDPDEFLATRR